MQLQLLGRFLVRRDGDEVPPAAFGGRKVRTLLRVLAVRRPELVPHEVLAEALWPDRLPSDPAGNLGVLVNRARRAVGVPDLIVTGTGGYALGECATDVAEFVAAAEGARTSVDDEERVRACAAALALWGEPLVEDTYADWARDQRERLHRMRVELCERGAAAALALGDPGQAVAWAAEAVAAAPLRESAVLVLARALAAAGDPAGALARIADLRKALSEELGVDPSPEVAALHLALLRGEPVTTSRRPGPVGALRVEGEPTEAAPVNAVRAGFPVRAVPTTGPFRELEFVGRDDELTRLRAAVGAGRVVLLAGPAGTGKTRLLAELGLHTAQPVLATRAFLPERSEAWGLARSLLREALAIDADAAEALPARTREALSGLLPELEVLPSGQVLDGESLRALIVTGALRLLDGAVGSGALLVVDDLQWADPSSLAFLGSAIARLPRLAAVLAFRPEELATEVRADLLGTRGDTTEIVLGPLPPDALGPLVRDPALVTAIAEGTDCTPFAVAELLRELAARHAIIPGGRGGWTLTGPGAADVAVDLGRAGQRRAVQRRAARQRGKHAEVLALVALLAREASAQTIAAAAGLDGRATLEVLSALAGAGLLRLGEQGWAGAHDLVSEAVAETLSDGERGRLHALLARALEAEDADPSEVARHHREAGDAAAAARTFAGAAGQALRTHSTREALALATAGLALNPRATTRAELLTVRAEAAAAHGDLAPALTDLRDAIVATDAGPARAHRRARLAMLTSGSRDVRQAAELAELALVEAAEDPAARAVALETTAILDMNLDRPERAERRSEAALALYRQLGDAHGVARILDGRAMAAFLDGRITEGTELFDRVAGLLLDSGELLRVVTPRSTRGHGLVFMGRPADGLVEAGQALRLARELDAPEGQAYALWHRSEALSGLGRAQEAEADAREALAVAHTVDHRGWTATAYRALGIALAGRGELDDAAAAFAASADAAGESLTLFASWAAARSALVAVDRGEPAGAFVDRALALGPPLAHYEARLAAVELAAARNDPACARLAAAALTRARDGGHLVSVRRLTELAETPHPREEAIR